LLSKVDVIEANLGFLLTEKHKVLLSLTNHFSIFRPILFSEGSKSQLHQFFLSRLEDLEAMGSDAGTEFHKGFVVQFSCNIFRTRVKIDFIEIFKELLL
jgi:hypothetical protein